MVRGESWWASLESFFHELFFDAKISSSPPTEGKLWVKNAFAQVHYIVNASLTLLLYNSVLLYPFNVMVTPVDMIVCIHISFMCSSLSPQMCSPLKIFKLYTHLSIPCYGHSGEHDCLHPYI